MNKNILISLQGFALCGLLVWALYLQDERDWLREAYYSSLGLANQAVTLAESAAGIAERYEAEVRTLRREQVKGRITAYIQSVNPKARANDIAEAVLTASDATGIEPAWLLAKLKQESYFNHRAVSSTGCRGLAQMCMAAAQDVGLRWEDAFKIEANVLAGAAYLRLQLDASRGDMARALYRYNGGDDPDFVQKIRQHRQMVLRALRA
jgi:soluble lytic murein transglycosylase-like protein